MRLMYWKWSGSGLLSCSRVLGVAAGLVSTGVLAEPNITGLSGLIEMPDARVEQDGTFRFGQSWSSPYHSWWASLNVLPRVEAVFNFAKIYGVQGFADNPGYGDYKDKVLGGKFVLFTETDLTPAVAVGAMDVQGTQIFKSNFLTASKRFGNLDLTAGYGGKRIDGLFGGLRYRPEAWNGFGLVAEYNANNYKNDLFADVSGAAQRRKGTAYGVEYRWGWVAAQLAREPDAWAANAYITVPFDVKEWVPKSLEPEPYVKLVPRPTAAQWRADSSLRDQTVLALLGQDFRNVRLDYTPSDVLQAELTNSRISQPSRAIGRAARVLLAHAPLETREIRISYSVRDLPVSTYVFFDVPLLQRYFNGTASRSQLARHVSIELADPAVNRPERPEIDALMASLEDARAAVLSKGDQGDVTLLRAEDSKQNRFGLRPQLGTYLNDPSGAFHYDFNLLGSVDRNLGDRLFLKGAVQLTLAEDISNVQQPSNSQLPHVRSDVADYKSAGNFKLGRLLLNKFYHLDSGVYGRLSAGFYEEMYAGTGGQILYAPAHSAWAADLSVDALAQRDTRGWFGFRDYRTVTAIGTLHYRLAKGLTARARVGRFLARDEGVRLELARRFQSGVEFGVWYTVTNGNDITMPGSPSSPYHDKGVFLSLPFSPMLPYDSQMGSGFSISPWTRDVGQMVASPEDLYGMLENPLIRNLQDRGGMVGLGDIQDDYDLPSLGTSLFERPLWDITRHDTSEGFGLLGQSRFWKAAGAGLVATALSSSLDRKLDHQTTQHRLNERADFLRTTGNALPLVGLGISAMLTMHEGDRLSSTALAATQAGATAAILAQTLKYGVGRARPSSELGPGSFGNASSGTGGSSFPSRHTAVAWAVVTPYAEEYGMPWLYGLAALTNYARVTSREHWFSDTVAGGLMGYGLGQLFWQWRREDMMNKPSMMVSPNSVAVNVPWN